MYGDAAALAWTPSYVSIPHLSYLLPYMLERPGQLWPRLGTCWMYSTGDVCEIFWAFRGKISQQRGHARKNESGQSTRYSWQKTKTIHWSRPTSSIIKTSQCSSTVDPRRWEEEKRQKTWQDTLRDDLQAMGIDWEEGSLLLVTAENGDQTDRHWDWLY